MCWWLFRVATREPAVAKGLVRTLTWSVKAAAPFIRMSSMTPAWTRWVARYFSSLLLFPFFLFFSFFFFLFPFTSRDFLKLLQKYPGGFLALRPLISPPPSLGYFLWWLMNSLKNAVPFKWILIFFFSATKWFNSCRCFGCAGCGEPLFSTSR